MLPAYCQPLVLGATPRPKKRQSKTESCDVYGGVMIKRPSLKESPTHPQLWRVVTPELPRTLLIALAMVVGVLLAYPTSARGEGVMAPVLGQGSMLQTGAVPGA